MLKKVLYIGWIGYKNLGDELMFDLFKEQFSSLGRNVKLDMVNCEHRYLKNINMRDYHLIVLGGGSILNGRQFTISPLIIDFLYGAIQSKVKVMIWGTGLDWFERETIPLLDNNERVPNIFVTPQHREKLKAILSESVWSGIRGPLTYEVFRQLELSDLVQISGDPGFLLQSDPLSRTTKSDQKKIIGVNWGTSFNYVYGNNELQTEDQLVQALRYLITKNYAIHLYVLWQQDVEASKRLFNKIDCPEAVYLDTNVYNHHQLMDVLKHFHFTINFKLHANYLSLAANIPFIALGYRFKIYDFVQSIDSEQFLIEMNSDHIMEEILDLEEKINTDGYRLVKKMSAYKELYRNRLIEPFRQQLFLNE